VASRAGRELAHVVLALADDLGDLWIVIVDVVEQQNRSLLGREALQPGTRGKRSDSEDGLVVRATRA
jgi:hypothetical protein